MANLVEKSDLTYAGKEAQEIFSKRVYNLDMRNYGITLRDNVKGKEKLYTGEVSDVWQKYSCAFSAEGKATLTEQFIEPARIKVNLEECFDAFDGTYFVEQTKIALDGGVPQTFADWFFNEKLLPKMDKEYQEIFWQGDTEHVAMTKKYLAVTDGIEKKLRAGKGVEQVTTTAFTVDNILAQVEAAVLKGVEKAAKDEVPTDDYKIMMNYADIKLLVVALGKLQGINLTNSVFANYSKDGDKVVILGYEVVPTMQSRSTVIFGPIDMLVLGFDTFDSHLEYRIIDMRETTGDNKFRVLALSNIAVGVVLPSLFTYARLDKE